MLFFQLFISFHIPSILVINHFFQDIETLELEKADTLNH